MARRRRRHKKHRKHARKLGRPWNKGRRFHRGPRRRHGRRHLISNPRYGRRHHRHHRRYRRRRNPDMGMLWKVGLAAVAGIGISIAGGMLIDAALPTQTVNVKKGILVAGAAATAIFLGPRYPLLAAGMATGLVLVPGQQLVAGFLAPGPTAGNPQVTQSGLGLLHTRGLGLLHAGTGYAMGAWGGRAPRHAPLGVNPQDIADDELLRRRGIID